MKKSNILTFIFGGLFYCVVTTILLFIFSIPKKEKELVPAPEGFSIMIFDDTTQDYIESEGLPIGNYKLNSEKSYCTNGGTIDSYDKKTGALEYSVEGTDECVVYLDFNPVTYLANHVIELAGQDYETTQTVIYDATWTVKNEDNTGYRYMGENPDNFVSFNGVLWRIIGAFDGREIQKESGTYYTKIILDEPLGNASLGGCFNYLNSLVYKSYLKPYYTETNNLNSNSMIVSDAAWYGNSVTSVTNYTINDWYVSERMIVDGQITGKYIIDSIGLIYASDYGYASYGSECQDKATVNLSTSSSSNYNLGCYKVNYLYEQNGQFILNSEYSFGTVQATEMKRKYFITPLPVCSDGSSMYVIQSSGTVDLNLGVCCTQSFDIKPTIYLKSTVEITDGDGTIENPYQIVMSEEI